MRRRKILREEDEKVELVGADSETGKERQSLDSVDDQIDNYLLKYESGSLRSGEDEMIMESLRHLNMRFLLEQEEDEGAPAPAAPAGDKSADAPTGSETTKKKPKGVNKAPPLDIDSFTKKVVRLVMNYQNLMRIEPVIVNRAAAFLEKNYGKDYVDEMFDILDTQFGLDIDGEVDVIDVPIAAGAGVKVSAG